MPCETNIGRSGRSANDAAVNVETAGILVASVATTEAIHEKPTRLARRLGTTDAVLIGHGSMIAAGGFAALGPAAAAAGVPPDA